MPVRCLSLAILAMALLSACAAPDLLGELPRPDDARPVRVTDNYDQGYVTSMVEPEVFDFYTVWLSDHGWERQAPTEAFVSLPHQLWRKDELELLIELQPTGRDEGLTSVWLRLTDRSEEP